MRNFIYYATVSYLALFSFLCMFNLIWGMPILGWFSEFHSDTQNNLSLASLVGFVIAMLLATVILRIAPRTPARGIIIKKD